MKAIKKLKNQPSRQSSKLTRYVNLQPTNRWLGPCIIVHTTTGAMERLVKFVLSLEAAVTGLQLRILLVWWQWWFKDFWACPASVCLRKFPSSSNSALCKPISVVTFVNLFCRSSSIGFTTYCCFRDYSAARSQYKKSSKLEKSSLRTSLSPLYAGCGSKMYSLIRSFFSGLSFRNTWSAFKV